MDLLTCGTFISVAMWIAETGGNGVAATAEENALNAHAGRGRPEYSRHITVNISVGGPALQSRFDRGTTLAPQTTISWGKRCRENSRYAWLA